MNYIRVLSAFATMVYVKTRIFIMKNAKFYVFVTLFVAVVATATAGMYHMVKEPFSIEGFVADHKGQMLLPRDGLKCAWFEEDLQTICFSKDVPMYVVAGNKCTPLYGPCPVELVKGL